MFYKFVGGDGPALGDIFDKAVDNGSLKFTSALEFDDPFEFKFNSIVPSREAFDAWQKTEDPGCSAEDLEHGWAYLSGGSADWKCQFRAAAEYSATALCALPRSALGQPSDVGTLCSRPSGFRDHLSAGVGVGHRDVRRPRGERRNCLSIAGAQPPVVSSAAGRNVSPPPFSPSRRNGPMRKSSV